MRTPDYVMREAVCGQRGVDDGVLTLDPFVGFRNQSLSPTLSAERRVLTGDSTALGEATTRDESANRPAGAIGTSELLGDKQP